MRITQVHANNRKQAFEVHSRSGSYVFPYSQVRPSATRDDRIVELHVDPEMGREGFVYQLESGREGAVHIDHVLEYNRDPSYMADQLLYELTMQAKEAFEASALSTREIARRLGTSPTQLYRLLDPTNSRKSLKQLLALLGLLGCEVDVVVRSQRPRKTIRLSLTRDRRRA